MMKDYLNLNSAFYCPCSCATPASVTLKRLACLSIIVVAVAKASVISAVSTRCRYQRAAGCSLCASATIAISSCSVNRMRYRVRKVRSMAEAGSSPHSLCCLSLSLYLSCQCISFYLCLSLPSLEVAATPLHSSLLKSVICYCLSYICLILYLSLFLLLHYLVISVCYSI